MKNILFIICALFVLVLISNYITKENLIPEDAIRIRVIANSNSEDDQNLKIKIKDEIETLLYSRLKDVKNIDEADVIIKKELPSVKEIIDKYTVDYKINYGLNYFPKKKYKGVEYDEGNYKSLVVTLGNGLGDNWWCVLFPPLCLLEAQDSTDVEYHSYVVDLINKYK